MTDDLNPAIFLATVLNLKVNIDILTENKKRVELAVEQGKKLDEIIGLLENIINK